jgi:crossover junction endodeoxyribonuclease RuvC
MRVLAVDPALRKTGFAILERPEPEAPAVRRGGRPSAATALFYGVIENPKARLPSACLVEIRSRLAEVIRDYRPDACAVEGIIYVQSHRTAITMGAARGAALIAAAEAGLPIREYPPTRVKQAAVGRGSATKDQVAFMMRALLGLAETPPADAADALAIGLAHLNAASAGEAFGETPDLL